MREFLIRKHSDTEWTVYQVVRGHIETNDAELSQPLATYRTGIDAAQAVRAMILRDAQGGTTQ